MRIECWSVRNIFLLNSVHRIAIQSNFGSLIPANMNSIKKYLLPFICGLVVAMTLHISYRCQKDNEPISEDENLIKIDLNQVNKDAQKAEDAFLSGKTDNVKSVIHEDALKIYKDAIESQSPERLTAFGNAFKKRKLINHSEIYSEYEFSEGNKTFTIAFAMTGDKTWKIVRL